jgi:hypothetical protein
LKVKAIKEIFIKLIVSLYKCSSICINWIIYGVRKYHKIDKTIEVKIIAVILCAAI